MKDPIQSTLDMGLEEEGLQAQIQRITYVNEDTGYTVARASVPGFPEPVTIVGNLLALSPGEVLRVQGSWERHPKFGRQFRVKRHETLLPQTVQGIRKYLGSGLIKGIGPVMAARIVAKFGDKTLEIIDKNIGRLTSVQGLGRKRVRMIKQAWDDQKEIRSIMIFLQEHGIGLSHATKIFKRYGQRSIAVVSQNPYKLATEISGIGFKTADRIARRLGFVTDAPVRVEAGILYVLNQLAEEGHVYYPYEPLIERCRDILKVDRDTIVKAFSALALEEKIVIEDLNRDLETFEPNLKAVYLARFHVSENGIARHILRLASSKKSVRHMDPEKAIEWVQKRVHLRLALRQIEAVKHAVSDKALIITGGPGTGKTTIIHAVIQIYAAVGARIFMAAPTGRAAKRMSEATGHRASTIHRMLAFNWQGGGFRHNEQNPIPADVIVLDEASMIDNILMNHLLKAIPSEATLIVVGDSNQLPSVGPGNVLKDMIHSGLIPVVELSEIFRQARESLIIVNAHRINQGMLPKHPGKELGDYYFIEEGDPDQALQKILELVSRRVPQRFRLNPKEDIQVLAPMHKGTLGTENLNVVLQNALNPAQKELVRGERRFRLYDKVMQIRNNYEKEVFNGDIGLIQSIDPENNEITVSYDGRPVEYDYSELDEIVLAYAISVHKSQGSEYPAVILPILPQHHLLLQRNLIYTAVTRGKRLVVMVGTKRALATGVKDDRTVKRYTFLAERLKEAIKSLPQPPLPHA